MKADRDSGQLGADAGSDAAAAAATNDASATGGSPSVDMPIPDANVAASGDEDAGVVLLSVNQQCTASWPDLQTGSVFCRFCACNACASEVVDCLTLGDEPARAHCREILACALKNHCQDGACYCASSGCGYPSPSGDGPCATAIEAAVGGTRTRVFALRQQEPPKLEEPFMRAVGAIGCLYGTDDAAPGPILTAKCPTSCY
jgi:hypothetical protein